MIIPPYKKKAFGAIFFCASDLDVFKNHGHDKTKSQNAISIVKKTGQARGLYAIIVISNLTIT
jgi:hypothetical protein